MDDITVINNKHIKLPLKIKIIVRRKTVIYNPYLLTLMILRSAKLSYYLLYLSICQHVLKLWGKCIFSVAI